MQQDRKTVSIIIPSFKQEKTIVKDIMRIYNVMEQLRHDFEIIVIIDGIVDKTLQETKKIKSDKITVFSYPNNHGKGYAIRYGVGKANGDVIGFIDSGMEINPNGISLLLEHMEWYDSDIIVGSKRHPASKVNFPIERRIISKLAQVFIKILFGIGVSDTQAGIKFFKRKVLLDVFPRLIVKEFAFDIEVLAVAKHIGYKRIFEAPIELNYNRSSSVISLNLWKTVWRTFIDTLGIFYRMHILHYYSNTNRRKWKYDSELNLRINLP